MHFKHKHNYKVCVEQYGVTQFPSVILMFIPSIEFSRSMNWEILQKIFLLNPQTLSPLRRETILSLSRLWIAFPYWTIALGVPAGSCQNREETHKRVPSGGGINQDICDFQEAWYLNKDCILSTWRVEPVLYEWSGPDKYFLWSLFAEMN
jgi:hypothetical protein